MIELEKQEFFQTKYIKELKYIKNILQFISTFVSFFLFILNIIIFFKIE